jgi:hypothetical protein
MLFSLHRLSPVPSRHNSTCDIRLVQLVRGETSDCTHHRYFVELISAYPDLYRCLHELVIVKFSGCALVFEDRLLTLSVNQ